MFLYFSFNLEQSIMSTSIHEYGYYNTHTLLLTYKYIKIPISITYVYPFKIFIYYLLQVLYLM